jgi:hypothetical protein
MVTFPGIYEGGTEMMSERLIFDAFALSKSHSGVLIIKLG